MARVALIARIECRSDAAAEQRPVAVWLAGERIAVAEVLDDAVFGHLEAGRSHRRRVRVRLADGQELLLERDLPRGSWRVYRS